MTEGQNDSVIRSVELGGAYQQARRADTRVRPEHCRRDSRASARRSRPDAGASDPDRRPGFKAGLGGSASVARYRSGAEAG